MSKKRTLRRLPIEAERRAFRFVGTDSIDPADLAPWFISDREDGKEPDSREREYPELQDGCSMYGTERAAQIRWAGMRKNAIYHGEQDVRVGAHIAELVLKPEEGFDIEDRDKRDQHLTVWGEAAKLAASVCRVFRAERTD